MDELDASVAWARANMPLTEKEIDALGSLSGVRLGCSVHLEHKCVPFFEALLRNGARVFLTTCNPHTVRDDVVARLVSHGAEAHAWNGMSASDQDEAARRALDWGPTHLYEMGAALCGRLLEGAASARVVAGLEATGSGILRITGLTRAGKSLAVPVFNCDGVPIKEGLHNRHLVGLTTWHSFMERTLLSLHGRRVLVIGFGLVGQGVAETARSFGGTVSVAEKDPSRALFAAYAGYPTGSTEEMVPHADVIVTATGRRGVLTARHFGALKEGCFLLNVGHTGDEIDVEALGPRRKVVPFVEEVSPHGKNVFLFAGGSMANLTAGHGDSLNSFDVTMATLAAGVRFLLSPEAARFEPGLHPLPRNAWEHVARTASGV
jgi:adenosylhomocysteinase